MKGAFLLGSKRRPENPVIVNAPYEGYKIILTNINENCNFNTPHHMTKDFVTVHGFIKLTVMKGSEYGHNQFSCRD